MADTTFTDGVTATAADWFNDVNRLQYTIFGDPASGAAAFYTVVNALTADASPDPTADYVTTLDASASTNKKVLLNKLVQFKIGSFTRDISLATGTQAVTGVGFKPRLVLMLQSGAAAWSSPSIGFSDGTVHMNLFNNNPVSADTWINDTARIVTIAASGSDSYAGTISALGSDGFTMSWTRTGSPTGTTTLIYLAIG